MHLRNSIWLLYGHLQFLYLLPFSMSVLSFPLGSAWRKLNIDQSSSKSSQLGTLDQGKLHLTWVGSALF